MDKQEKINEALENGVLVTHWDGRVRYSDSAKYRLKIVSKQGSYPANCQDIDCMVISSKSRGA